MRVGIFTGTINIQKESTDVRKLYILERLKYFVQDNIQFEIITPQVNVFTLYKINNIRYNTYKQVNKKHFKIISTLIFSSNKLKNLDCEMMHCYTHQAAVLAWIVNRFRKKKYLIIFEPMGLAYEESKLNRKSSLKVKLIRPFIKFEEKLIFQRSDAIAVYTDILKNYVSKEFNVAIDKICIIPHGVDFSDQYLADKLEKSSLLNKLNAPETNKVILYAGSLSELHGTPLLIEAIGYLNERKKNISFLIMGHGSLENKLRDWIEKNKLTNVHLLGFVPSEDVRIYFSLADILLIPHAKCMQTELDQPTKLFEYLASGKPIVSFNLKAIAEVVGDNAVLVEPDNPQAFADGILTLLNNEKLCREFGERGKIIARDYSWEASAKKQYDMYKNIYEKHQIFESVNGKG